MAYLDVLRSGTFREQVSALLITNTDQRSTSDSLADISWIQIASLQLYRRNMPLLHMSRYVTARDQFYQASPHVSTASDKHWG